MLSKLVALDKFGGRDEWTTSLPIVVKNINESCAYGSPLSRSALQFGPLHHSNPALVLEDPFLMQQNTLDRVNLKRIQNLMNNGVWVVEGLVAELVEVLFCLGRNRVKTG